MVDQGFISYFANADPIVKSVMLVLLLASVISYGPVAGPLDHLRMSTWPGPF